MNFAVFLAVNRRIFFIVYSCGVEAVVLFVVCTNLSIALVNRRYVTVTENSYYRYDYYSRACFRINLLKKFSGGEYKGEKIIALGPMPARVAKVSEKYRYRLIIKCRNSARLRQMISRILIETETDSRFSKVSVYAEQ